jgi:hypothetical protein
MTDHVVKATPGEERASRWWPLVGLGACLASAAVTLWPVVRWVLSRPLEQQREIVATVVAGAVVMVGLGLMVEAGTGGERRP